MKNLLLLLFAVASCATAPNGDDSNRGGNNENTTPISVQDKVLNEALTDSRSRLGNLSGFIPYTSSITFENSKLTNYSRSELYIKPDEVKGTIAVVYDGEATLSPTVTTTLNKELVRNDSSQLSLRQLDASAFQFESLDGTPITDLNGYTKVYEETITLIEEWKYLDPKWKDIGLKGIKQYRLVKINGDTLYYNPIDFKSGSTTTFIVDINSKDPDIIYKRQ